MRFIYVWFLCIWLAAAAAVAGPDTTDLSKRGGGNKGSGHGSGRGSGFGSGSGGGGGGMYPLYYVHLFGFIRRLILYF